MIRIELFSRRHHLKQILTGFHLFGLKTGERIKIIDRSKNTAVNTIACLVYYNGKKIVYDVQDGYQDFEAMKYLLSICDFYFKRNFSAEENEKLRSKIERKQDVDKMYPLGFNYTVTYQWSPLNYGTPWKEHIKRFLGYKDTPNAYFKPEVFEGVPDYDGKDPTIFFQTRLWDIPEDYPEWKKEQWNWINNTRLSIIRTLKREFPNQFDGGLIDNGIDHKFAPELLLPKSVTQRETYIKRMKKSDICIGTTGLHMSIGGKTGEYVAAARAIVHEKFYYTVTGDFEEGKNYLEFTDADQCIANVYKLIDNPDLIYDMQKSNYEYYKKYLEPCQLIANTLEIIKGKKILS